MLTPDDVRHDTADEGASRLANLEKDFDSAIRRAEAGGWPAIVPIRGGGPTGEQIAAVAQRYRDAGWLVDLGESEGGVRASIRHPG